MSDVRIKNPLEDGEWDELAATHPDCTVFHTSAWARSLQQAYGYQPNYLIVKGGSQLQGLIPLFAVNSLLTGSRGVSLPFTDYCAPLIFAETAAGNVLQAALDTAREARWKYVELRDGSPLTPRMTPAESFVNHYLLLNKTEAELFAALHKNHRRNIGKAEKGGVEIRQAGTLQATREFYQLNCLTRREHGLPPQPFGFFEKVQQNLFATGCGFIMSAYFESRCIASCIFLHFAKKAVYKYGASDKQFTSTGANQLLMWEAIRWFQRNQFEHFCFGRTERQNEGLLRYKSGWGTLERPIDYYRYVPAEDRFVLTQSKLSGAHNRIFGNMPLPLLKLAGKLLYRHMA